jgi:molybdopterin converting factor small subunit
LATGIRVKAMEIEIKLFATLRDYLPAGSGQYSCKLKVNSTDTVRDVLKRLKIPDEIPKIILVNGVHANFERVLKGGDVLSVFPPVAGG